MKHFPTVAENPDGLHQRYTVTPLYEPPSNVARYIVLRVDQYGDDEGWTRACRCAVTALAHHYLAHKPKKPKLAFDLLNLVEDIEKEISNG